MSRIDIITTSEGEKIAILPLAEYERLLEIEEDLEDLRAYDRAKARLAAGTDELIPAEFANRLLDGEAPVKVWREFRGLTLEDLAKKTKLDRDIVLRLETGRPVARGAITDTIAAALGVTASDLVGPVDAT